MHWSSLRTGELHHNTNEMGIIDMKNKITPFIKDSYYHDDGMPLDIPLDDGELVQRLYDAESTAHMLWTMYGPLGVFALILFMLDSPDFDGDYTRFPDDLYARTRRWYYSSPFDLLKALMGWRRR